MANIHLELEPENIDCRVFSNVDDSEDNMLVHGRFISLSGKPVYSGTYPHSEINLNRNGDDIDLPDFVTVVIKEAEISPQVIGSLNYVQSWSDEELGIGEPEQFSAEIDYPEKQFEKAWNLVDSPSLGELKIIVSIKAPEIDISGYISNLDLNKSEWWPIYSLSIFRKCHTTTAPD